MAHIVLEQTFEQPISDADYAAFAQRLDPCLDMRRGGWVRSYLSTDRKRALCEFEAPDAESVREALRSANVPFDRVWAGEVFRAEDYPEHASKLARLRGG